MITKPVLLNRDKIDNIIGKRKFSNPAPNAITDLNLTNSNQKYYMTNNLSSNQIGLENSIHNYSKRVYLNDSIRPAIKVLDPKSRQSFSIRSHDSCDRIGSLKNSEERIVLMKDMNSCKILGVDLD